MNGRYAEYGLLQTRSYASAVIRACRPYDIEEALEREAAARIERQNILIRDDPPKLWVVLGEGVLRQSERPMTCTATAAAQAA